MFRQAPLVRVQKISDPLIASMGVELFMLRLDLIHPQISGNKWFKLKYNLEEAARQGQKTLLTFGGAYSNHIAATAAAGREAGFKTIGVIRGEPTEPLNNVLEFSTNCGMYLHYISREAYKTKTDPDFFETLKDLFGDFYLLPEGGSNSLAVKGCMEILNDVDQHFDHVCCTCGTGTTLAGIILSLKEKQNALGFTVLKGGDFLVDDIRVMLKAEDNGLAEKNKWSIQTGYHFGGYAKNTDELKKFIERFEAQNKIPIEFVYTGKMMFGIYDLAAKGYFKKGERILAVHTGGVRLVPPLAPP